jgi:FkbM family methyltransferase
MQEPPDAVLHREQFALEEALSNFQSRVVLFGAGGLGRRAAKALESIGVRPLAFSDNNLERWGKEIDGILVLPPTEAARLYGGEAAFLLTIWNPFHWFSETAKQLQGYGCQQIIPYPPLFWRFPQLFLPALFNDLPHKVYLERNQILAAKEIWADEQSRSIYEANIRLRTMGTPDSLPSRPVENTYFPQDIFFLANDERILDCGATLGEMTQDLIRKRGDHFGRFFALEADKISFSKLVAYRESLPDSLSEKLKLYDCAVGLKEGIVYFTNTGDTASHISAKGIPVKCYHVDTLFADIPLTFIKMDIEGAEYDALLGGRKVIERDQPILAICVYHTQNDIWRIPLLLHEMLPQHKFYLRGYEGDGFQTVLFAVPPGRVVQGTDQAF